MNETTIRELLVHGYAVDTETWRIQAGSLCPPLVCGSISWFGQEPGTSPRIQGAIYLKDEFLEVFARLLEDPNAILIFANGPFDLGVIATELAKRGIDVMPWLFAKLAAGKIVDVQTAEALNAIGHGHLGLDPRTGGKLKNPETGKPGSYSLSMCVSLTLGRSDAKVNDEWRLNYHMLDGVPLEQWPPAARDYPIDDTNNTYEVCAAQAGHLPSVGQHHFVDDAQGNPICVYCGATRHSAQCVRRLRHLNLHEVATQTYSAFALHLGAAHGFRVDQTAVDVIESYYTRKRARLIAPFIQGGLIREDGTQDQSLLKRMVALAYGATQPCPHCRGTGKIPSPKQKPIRCTDCKGACLPTAKDGPKCREWRAAHPNGCTTCSNTGSIPHPDPKMIACCIPAHGEGDDEESAQKTCDGTGLVLTPAVPRTEKGGVGAGKDPLAESGQDFLMSYADYLEDQKVLAVYVPFLRQARVVDTEGAPARDIPLTLRPNVMLETGRVSYSGAVQLMPRKPGFTDKETGKYIPSLRECFTARPGYVLSSEDYEAGELVTHAQSCRWLVGFSKLGDALVSGVKVHNALAATMTGVPYDEFQKHVKERKYSDARQAAKPGNFGLPGLMGPLRLVHQQREQGPDTPCPNGPAQVDSGEKDAQGNPILVPGYRGLRFCILMDGADQCGTRMTYEYREQPIAPTCVHCIECATRLKDIWMRQWPENRQYFKFVTDCVNRGMVITREALERWPWLQDVFTPGQQLSPGQIMQHVTGRVRGGLEPSACANGFFQASLADACKSAHRRVTRECYDRTLRVPELLRENSKRSRYAGCESPLFGSRPIVFQHDEILLEHAESIAHDAATRVAEIMVDELRWFCPDIAPACNVEPTLMRRWLKTAKPKWARGGDKAADEYDRLIPWEPSCAP